MTLQGMVDTGWLKEIEERLFILRHAGAATGGQIGAHVVERVVDFRRKLVELDVADCSRDLPIVATDIDRILDGIDGRPHDENAARRERPPLAVVGENHRLLHRFGNLGLAAEDLADGLAEEIAHFVVGLLRGGRAN